MSIQHCPKCNNLYETEYEVCPYCGFHKITFIDNKLPKDYILHSRYIIDSFHRKCSDGLLYYGYDIKEKIKINILEFYPDLETTRNEDGSISYKTIDHIIDRKEYLQEKIEIYKRLTDIHHIISPYDFFEENNTIYIISELFPMEVISLNHFVQMHGPLSYDELQNSLYPVFYSIGKMHERGILHNDICPINIQVAANKECFLELSGSERDIKNNLYKYDSPSSSYYSAIELYSSKKEKGEYSDVYSCAAVMYYALTGIRPANVLDCIFNNIPIEKPSELGFDIPPKREQLLMKGLEINPKNRPQSMEELFDDDFNFSIACETFCKEISLNTYKMNSQRKEQLYQYLCDYRVNNSSVLWNIILYPPYFSYQHSILINSDEIIKLFKDLGEHFNEIEAFAYGFGYCFYAEYYYEIRLKNGIVTFDDVNS